AEAVDPQAQPSPVVPKPPPEPIQEVPPDQKPEGENVTWIPGYWDWDTGRNDYVWVSGFWRVPPPGRMWVPGTWLQTEGGWQWTHGSWTEPQQNELQYRQQPPPTVESGPSVPAPQEDSNYVPGTWIWQDGWVWRPGYWIEPQPGFVYVPPRYLWSPAGY